MSLFLIKTIRDLYDAFSPWLAQTVKQEQAIAAAKVVLDRHYRAAILATPDISPETREIIGDVFGTASLVSDRPITFTLEEVDSLLKVQHARTVRSIDPAGMRTALERIERWFDEFPDTGRTYDNGAPISYGMCWGSNGERDYMRGVARAALAKVNPTFEASMIESMREFADLVMAVAQDCCIDPDAGPDSSAIVQFTGKEGCEIATSLHRLLNRVAPERAGRAVQPEVPPAAAGHEARSGE